MWKCNTISKIEKAQESKAYHLKELHSQVCLKRVQEAMCASPILPMDISPLEL